MRFLADGALSIFQPLAVQVGLQAGVQTLSIDPGKRWQNGKLVSPHA